MCLTALNNIESYCLFFYGLSHLLDLFPIIWVVAHHVNLELHQIDLILGLEDGNLTSLALQFDLRSF